MSASKLTAEPGYRPHIDGLRAIAVLAVVLFHARVPGFGGGFVGVDVFFVISGYLIVGMLARELERSGTLSLAGFYERRIRRLLPASLLVLVATIVMAAVWLTPIANEQVTVAKSALATLGLVSNLYFATSTNGYFDQPADFQPLLHMWSLAVEEQFYLAWPPLLLLLGWLSRRGGVRVAVAVPATLLVLGALSLGLSIWLTPREPQWAFYLAPTRAWEFAAGGLLHFCLRAGLKPPRGASWVAPIGLVAVACAVLTFSTGMAFPGWVALLPVAGTVAVIAGCELAPAGRCARLLSIAPMVRIGVLSYSWYLWHWPLLSIARINSLEEPAPGVIAAVVAGSLLLAGLTYRYVEDPVRRRRVGLMGTPVRSYVVGIAGMTAAGVLAISLGLAANAQRGQHPASVAEVDRVPSRNGCDFGFGETFQISVPRCSEGARSGARQVLWGDSHARSWRPFVQGLADAEGASLATFSLPACAPMIGFTTVAPKRAGHAQRCADFNREVVAEIRRSDVTRVYLAARWPMYTGDSSGSAYERSPAQVQALASALQATSRALGGEVEVVLIGPIPELRRSAPWCIAHRAEAACAMSRREFDAYAAASRATLARLGRSSRMRFIDPVDLYCDAVQCHVTRHGIALYYDDDHASVSAARHLLGEWLRRMQATTHRPRVPGEAGG